MHTLTFIYKSMYQIKQFVLLTYVFILFFFKTHSNAEVTLTYTCPWAPAGIFPGGGPKKSVRGAPIFFLDEL